MCELQVIHTADVKTYLIVRQKATGRVIFTFQMLRHSVIHARRDHCDNIVSLATPGGVVSLLVRNETVRRSVQFLNEMRYAMFEIGYEIGDEIVQLNEAQHSDSQDQLNVAQEMEKHIDEERKAEQERNDASTNTCTTLILYQMTPLEHLTLLYAAHNATKDWTESQAAVLNAGTTAMEESSSDSNDEPMEPGRATDVHKFVIDDEVCFNSAESTDQVAPEQEPEDQVAYEREPVLKRFMTIRTQSTTADFVTTSVKEKDLRFPFPNELEVKI